jgi:RNA polymerase-binding transcription factor DksA
MATKKHAPAKKSPQRTGQPAPVAKKKIPVPNKKSATPSKPSKKPAVPAKKAPAPKPAAKAKPTAKAKPAATGKGSSREDLRSRVLARTKASKPIAFSLDEVRAIAKTNVTKGEVEGKHLKSAAKAGEPGKKSDAPAKSAKPAAPNHVKPASLIDVLGFNPKKRSNPTIENDEDVPEKYRRYYKLLIDLRNHVTGQLDQHTEETLKRSAKEDAGDLSSYGQHMADAGTDTFDRDFALSLVSNEQEALSEIEAAIQRIKIGTYGICEGTGKPIAKERLLAVPFARFSAEAQKEIERNSYRSRQQAGLFGEAGEEGAKISEDDSGGDE